MQALPPWAVPVIAIPVHRDGRRFLPKLPERSPSGWGIRNVMTEMRQFFHNYEVMHHHSWLIVRAVRVPGAGLCFGMQTRRRDGGGPGADRIRRLL